MRLAHLTSRSILPKHSPYTTYTGQHPALIPYLNHTSIHTMPKRQREAPVSPAGRTERETKLRKHSSPPKETVQHHQADVLRHPSVSRAKEIDADPPLQQLEGLLSQQRKADDHPPRNVLHWFRSKDLRIEDNKGLHAASAKAKEGKGHLITAYLWSPKDLEWHGTSAARSDFLLETLRLMQAKLEEMNVPLYIITAPERRDKSGAIMEFVKKWDVSHVFANLEYEVDELRRDIKIAKMLQKEENGVTFHASHDQTVVAPLRMTTGSGGPHKVFTPFHRAWLSLLKAEPALLEVVPAPKGNEKGAKEELKELFGSEVPQLPENKQFRDEEERQRVRGLWPAGHDAGIARCEKFLKEKVRLYAEHRSTPAKDPSSRLSPYFSAGVISVREALTIAKKANKGKNFDGSGDAGIAAWAREICFREFYRQVLAMQPHNSMNLPHNLKFQSVKYDEDYEKEKAWYEGKTGVPFVDAGMRQLNHEVCLSQPARQEKGAIGWLRCSCLTNSPLTGIHAQPCPHEHRLLPPHQPPHRLPQRGALLRRAPHRLGPWQQHARLGAQLHRL